MSQNEPELDIHGLLVDWCENVTDLTVVRAYSRADRPTRPYLLTKNLNGPREVMDNCSDVEYVGTGENNSEGNEIVNVYPVIESEWEFSIQSFHGDDAMEPLRKLRSRYQIDGPQQGINPLLSIFNMTEPKDLSEKINHVWEHRGHVRIFLRAFTRNGFPIDVIDEMTPATVTRI